MKRMFLLLAVSLHAAAARAAIPAEQEFTNSVGMKFVRVEPATFKMAQLKTPLPWQILPEFRGRGLFDNLFPVQQPGKLPNPPRRVRQPESCHNPQQIPRRSLRLFQ